MRRSTPYGRHGKHAETAKWRTMIEGYLGAMWLLLFDEGNRAKAVSLGAIEVLCDYVQILAMDHCLEAEQVMHRMTDGARRIEATRHVLKVGGETR